MKWGRATAPYGVGKDACLSTGYGAVGGRPRRPETISVAPVLPTNEGVNKFFRQFLSANHNQSYDGFRIAESDGDGAMADAGDGAGIGGAAGGEKRPAPQEMAKRALRMLERLVAGSTLIEVAAGEGLTPRRARELVAEVVAQRGFDP
jgi:hypothetical protein